MTEMAAMHVLVVEDDPMVRQLLQRAASALCNRVDIAEDGNRALVLLAQDNFDVIITDLKMPGVTGLEVLRFARQKQPNARLIAVSGFVEPEDETEILKLGARLLPKPFGYGQLRDALESAAASTG
jgi:CheY-like chemotaxis protein